MTYTKERIQVGNYLTFNWFSLMVSGPARGTSVTNLISISYTLFVVFLHLAPLQGGKDAAFGKGCKTGEGGFGL